MGRVLFKDGSLVDIVARVVFWMDAEGRGVFLEVASTKVEFLLAGTEGREVMRDEPVPLITVGARVMVDLGCIVTVDWIVGIDFFDVGVLLAALELIFFVGPLVVPGFLEVTPGAPVTDAFAEEIPVGLAFSGPSARQVEKIGHSVS